MSGNGDNVSFDRPQPVYRTSARLRDEERGDVFDVVLTGPQETLEAFIDGGVPLKVEWVPREVSDKLQESINQAYDDKQNTSPPAEEQEKEIPPSHPIGGIDMQIQPGQAWLKEHDLLVVLDPDIAQGKSLYLFVNGANEAWATCEVSGGDADLYLYEILEDSTWRTRDTSLRWGTQTDTVDAPKQATGNWSLRIYGYKDSTYELSGLFKL